jgi:C4-dicarboxylate transporter, DctM subunit
MPRIEHPHAMSAIQKIERVRTMFGGNPSQPTPTGSMIDLETEPEAAPKPPGRMLRVASLAVTLVLAAMILLPVAQTILRRFGADLASATTYTQHLTLWTGFIGAVLATLGGKHLSLTTIHLLPKGRIRLSAQIFCGAVTALVAVLLTVGAVMMVFDNRGNSLTFGAGIPVWWSDAIVPICLGAIAVLALLRAPGGWAGRIAALAACLLMIPLWKVHAHGHAGSAMLPGGLILVIAFLLGAPVYVTMAGLAMLLYFGDSANILGTVLGSVPNDTLGLVKNSTLPAVPLLTIAGYVLAAGGASQRLVAAYRALLGWMPGGMALMALSVCAVFTAFTGASGVTILAVGGVILPSLRAEKYPEGFSLGLVTAAGSLGLLFPPSLPVILYGVVAEADIKKLYLAGLVPGVIIITLVAIYAIIVGVRAKAPRHPFVWKDAARALWAAKWDLGLPIIIGGSIVTGVATIVEAAGIGALYSVIVEVAIFRNLHPWRDLPRVMAAGATLVGSVLILMGVALALTQCLVLDDIPGTILTWVQAHIHSQWGFLLALNAILLVLGSVLEMYSAIVVLAPLVIPLGNAFGVDPVHLGVVFLANLELGFLLPPMGLNLFLSATRFNQPLPTLYRRALPFLAIMTLGVLIITYLPHVTTGVLALFGVS